MPTRSKKRSKKFSFNPAVHGPIALALVFVLLVGFLAGISYMQEKPQMLLTQQALTGSFRPDATASGTYTLTFLGVKPHTLIYTDKPHRIVGSWTNTDFVARWKQGESATMKHTAQAVLMSHSPVDGKEYSIVVELTDPAFNAFAGTLTYKATVLPHVNPNGLVPSAERHNDAFPEILRSPALFIDGL